MHAIYKDVLYISEEPLVKKSASMYTIHVYYIYGYYIYNIRPPWRKDFRYKILYVKVNNYFTSMWNMYKSIIHNTTPLMEKGIAGVKIYKEP